MRRASTRGSRSATTISAAPTSWTSPSTPRSPSSRRRSNPPARGTWGKRGGGVSRPDSGGAAAVTTTPPPDPPTAPAPPHLLELARAWDRLRDDPALRCGVVTGAGGAFSAGMDLKTTIPPAAALARRERIPPDVFEALRRAADALLAGYDLHKPLIAAVDGPCLARGADMLIATDLRY